MTNSVKRFFSILLLVWPCFLSAQGLSSIRDECEALMCQGRYSEAKYQLILGLSEISEEQLIALKNDDPVFLERYYNDIIESKILSGDCITVFNDFLKPISFKSEREGIRRYHLNSKWLLQPGVRAYYEQQGYDALLTNVQLCEHMVSVFESVRSLISDAETIERLILDDLLIAYWYVDEEEKLFAQLDKLRPRMERIPEGSDLWPRYYWCFEGERCRKNGDLKQAERILNKSLNAMLSYDSEYAFIPWASLVELYNSTGNLNAVHDLTAQTAGVIRDKALEKLRRMTYVDRQMPLQNTTTIRAYNVLIKLPKGTYEDVLYDAALFSKHVLMDLDAETTRNVRAIGDKRLVKAYYDMLRLQGTEGSWYPNHLFLKLYQACHPNESLMHYSWRDVQKQLREHDVAIEFLRVGAKYQDYVALVLRKDWPRPELVELCNEDSIALLNPDAGSHREQARIAGQQTFDPIIPFLEDGDDVYYSCDGKFAQLNFDAFLTPSNELLSQKYRLHRVTSTLNIPRDLEQQHFDNLILFGGMDYDLSKEDILEESLLYHKVYPVEMFEWKTPAGASYVFGGRFDERGIASTYVSSLPYTNEEVLRIAASWTNPKGAFQITGKRAVEESFKYWSITSNPEEKNIFHIATHSCLLSSENLNWEGLPISRQEVAFKRDGLLFSGASYAINKIPYSPDKMNDGILFSEEISVLDLRSADIVVMSACNTAAGEDSLDGIYGLQRAFKIAGANTIIMTLWRTNDKATMRFMDVFYENLFSGNSKYASFNRAQQTIRHEYDNDPYYWAPFIMLD